MPEVYGRLLILVLIALLLGQLWHLNQAEVVELLVFIVVVVLGLSELLGEGKRK
jgi:hypothetical protein